MSKPAMWKPPTRREYKPKEMDPGQVVVWTREIPGRWTGDQWGEGTWIPGFSEEVIGEIWSAGPQPSTWWVVPDGSREPAIVRRAGKRDGYGHGGEGALYQPCTYPAGYWSRKMRAAENVRHRGVVFAVVDREEQSRSWSGSGAMWKTLTWHCDPDCPEAAGKPRDDGTGCAHGRYKPAGESWDVLSIADVMVGRIHLASPGPFCPRCVMLEPAPEPARELATA